MAAEHGATAVRYVLVPDDCVFAGKAIPYRNAIVFTVKMDKPALDTAPSFEAFLEGRDGQPRPVRAVEALCVELPHAPLTSPERYVATFGTRPRFDAARILLELDIAWWSAPVCDTTAPQPCEQGEVCVPLFHEPWSGSETLGACEPT